MTSHENNQFSAGNTVMTKIISSGIVSVSRQRHHGKRWQRFHSYFFAESHSTVPLVLAEVERAAASLPFSFGVDGNDIEPVALLKVTDGKESAVVSADGRWRAAYVPSHLRTYPFSTRFAGQGKIELLVDESSGLINEDATGELFFDDTGNPSRSIEQILKFFSEREADRSKTLGACAEIARQGLFMPFEMAGVRPNIRESGILMINRDKFRNIDADTIAALHAAGALPMIYAHFVSLAHLPTMARIEQAEVPESLRTALAVSNGLNLQNDPAFNDFVAAISASWAQEAL
jgi:hypothetical protein